MYRVSVLIIFWLLTVVSFDAFSHAYQTNSSQSKAALQAKLDASLKPLLVRVTGYGAFNDKNGAQPESQRLMALRVSKLDAYRSMAERVYGTGITGSSTVQDFVMKHDGFGTVVDSVIRGARVVSITENKGLGFETVLELLLPGDFKDCLTKVNSFRHGSNCLRALPQVNTVSDSRSIGSNSAKPTYKMDSLYFLQN